MLLDTRTREADRDAAAKAVSARWYRAALGTIVVAFVALGTLYSVATPIFESLDEMVHYPYVKFLADGRGLPVPSPDPLVNPAEREATQPPLYYAVAALATAWIDTGDQAIPYLTNPHAEKGQPGASDNKNLTIHSPDEAFPFVGVSLAVHLIRLLSVLMGAATVFLTYLIALEIAPRRPDLAVGAALLNALIPGFLFVAASVNNDNLIALLCSLGLFLLVRIVRRELSGTVGTSGARPLDFALLGAVGGLAALTKLGGLSFLALVGITLAFLAWRRRSIRSLVVWCVLTFVPAFAIGGWWYARNWLLYADPTLVAHHVAIVHGRPEPVTLLGLIFGENEGLRWSFWGVFGGFNVVADPLVYRIYDLSTLIAIVGLVVGLIRLGRGGRGALSRLARRPGAAAALVLAVWALVLYVSLLNWSMLTMASQGRFMFPAIAAICLAIAFGWRSLVPSLPASAFFAGIGAPLLALALLMPLRYIGPTYAIPPKLATGTIAAQHSSRAVDVSFADQMMLVSCQLSTERIVPGQSVDLDLYWRSLARMDRNYSIYIHVYDGAGKLVAQRDTYPGGGSYATSRLAPGDELHDRYLLKISPEARPGRGHLDVGLYEYPSLERLLALDGARRPIASPNVSSFGVYAASPAPGEPTTRRNIEFGDSIELLGYTLEPAVLKPGGEITGGIYWRAKERIDRDFTTFVHVAHSDQPPLAQYDGQPQGDGYPTSLWQSGDEVYQAIAIRLPENAPPGEYSLLVGMYNQPTQQRLEIGRDLLGRVRGALSRIGGSERAPVTSVEIGRITVSR